MCAKPSAGGRWTGWWRKGEALHEIIWGKCRLLPVSGSTLRHFHVLPLCVRARSSPESHPATGLPVLQEWVTVFLSVLVLKMESSLFWEQRFNLSRFCRLSWARLCQSPPVNMPGAHWQYLPCTVGVGSYHCRAPLDLPQPGDLFHRGKAAPLCLHALKRTRILLSFLNSLFILSNAVTSSRRSALSQLLSPHSSSSPLLLLANSLWSVMVITVCIYTWDVFACKPPSPNLPMAPSSEQVCSQGAHSHHQQNV